MNYWGFAMRRCLFAAACWSFLCIGAASAQDLAAIPEAATGSVSLGYDVWTGGFRTLDVTMDYSGDGEGAAYSGELTAVLQGPLTYLGDYTLILEADGQLSEEGLVPLVASMTQLEDDDKETRQIVYDSNGIPKVTEVDKHGLKEHEPPQAALVKSNFDPLSGGFALIWLVAHTEQCEGVARVFDGKKLIEITGKNAGTRVVEPSAYGLFSGEALVCELKLKLLADGKKAPRQDEMPTGLKVFLARMEPDGPLVPVRMEGESEFGAVMVHITKYEAN